MAEGFGFVGGGSTIPGVSFHHWLMKLRRHFHQVPELSYCEEKTASKIGEVLGELEVPFQTAVGKTGVLARLDAKRPGPTLALRADMDALPLDEENDLPYRSRYPGVMHACGHDGHVTIALGVARWLKERNWVEEGSGRILFIFQPAEEGGAGARAMLETGLLDGEPVEAIFAGHMHPELPAGHIGIAPGVCNAASDTVHIRLRGKGGHGAQPHLCHDPIVAGCYLVTQLQTIVSRSLPPMDPAVLTIGRFHSGTASNIIPQEAVLDGTLRTLSPEVRDHLAARLQEVVMGIGNAHRVGAEVEVVPGYPLLVNDPGVAAFSAAQGRLLLGSECVHEESPRMGAEDFAYFLQRWPGVMVRLGCHDPEKGFEHGLHSPHFNLDERALDVGVLLFTRLLLHYGAWKAEH